MQKPALAERGRACVLAAVLIALVVAAPASGHSTSNAASPAAVPAAVVDPATDPLAVGPRPPAAPDGPCSEQSGREQYAEGEGHDHLEIGLHQFSCNMAVRNFQSLLAQTDNPTTPVQDSNEVLGEMDVKGNTAAVAISYPRAGILFFDITNVAAPKFISRYRGAECEGAAIDVDCGAFVDLSADGKTAFLSVQQISVVPGGPPGLNEPIATPGVDVVDVATGRITGRLPIEGVGGVHTSRSHVVQPGPSSAAEPRRPGEYLFSVAGAAGAPVGGIEVSQVISTPQGKVLQKMGRIRMDEAHDMFIQDDPLTGRTLMYIASGADTGFTVYDVTDPTKAFGDNNQTLLAEWDLTPECETDWYAHTIDVATRNGRRYVTLPAELFTVAGDQSTADKAKGCGKFYGNGDKAGPMWIVDATDFAKLGRGTFADSQDNNTDEAKTDAALKQASQDALVTTWWNSAKRASGNLTFSPHNQQIVGDRIYLSNYHAGVTVLDASAAFAGQNVRPVETAFHVPHGTPTRPIYQGLVDPVVLPFTTTFIDFRPLIWDMVPVRGHVLAADMTGGFYSLQEQDPPSAAEQAVQPVEQPLATASSGQPARRVCQATSGFRSVSVRPRGRGLRLAFKRRRPRKVAVDVFSVSSGRRVVQEQLLARFRRKTRSFTWNGRSNNGRRLRDGYYLVRFRMLLGNGRSDSRRIVVQRVRGRFRLRPGSYRRASCGLLSSYKLERPVFGGAANRPLRIAFRLNQAAAVTVSVLRGRRVVRTYRLQAAARHRTYRLRFPAAGRPRGDYRVRIDAPGGARRVVAELPSRRL